MPISFVSTGAITADATPHTNLTVAMPGGIAQDDIIILMAWVRGQTDTGSASGYTAFTGSPVDQGAVSRYWMWWKRAGAGEGSATVTLTGTSGDAYGISCAFRGCIKSVSPIDVQGTFSTGTGVLPAVLTGITTGFGNEWIAAILAGEDTSNASGSVTGTDPAGYNNTYVESLVGAGACFSIARNPQGALGPTGDVSMDLLPIENVSGWGALIFALTPEPTSGPGNWVLTGGWW